MITLAKSKLTSSDINKITKEVDSKRESKELKSLKNLLSRKDVLALDNEKVDTLRLLMLHLEDKKNFNAKKFVDFLKR